MFDACDFSNTEWINSSFHRVIFKNCHLTGINFADSYLNHCQFINCTMPYISFNFSKICLTHFFLVIYYHLNFLILIGNNLN
ncbi:pentapeptide repeat-containing protein [Vagococcus luciliae]|uniref:pentapeptide repeat-containing protein n=1 Tax=Vagococcus luciliae TaxID=2920380 RepID=UPI003C705AFC